MTAQTAPHLLPAKYL